LDFTWYWSVISLFRHGFFHITLRENFVKWLVNLLVSNATGTETYLDFTGNEE
jgi:hypothetical protein